MPSGDADSVGGGWYVVGPDQQRYGPYDLAKLRSYVADGRLTPKSLVCQRGMSEWVAASTIPGLFGTATRKVEPAPAEIEGPAPQAGTAPMIRCSTCRQGFLSRQRAYRMSTLVVVIGYTLLVTTVIGVINVAFFWSLSLRNSPAEPDPDAVFTDFQIASATAPCSFIVYFAVGLLGSLLVMRKTVLKCSHCGVALNAS
jgi:hypothetical protein